jgi:hypothetical protein
MSYTGRFFTALDSDCVQEDEFVDAFIERALRSNAVYLYGGQDIYNGRSSVTWDCGLESGHDTASLTGIGARAYASPFWVALRTWPWRLRHDIGAIAATVQKSVSYFGAVPTGLDIFVRFKLEVQDAKGRSLAIASEDIQVLASTTAASAYEHTATLRAVMGSNAVDVEQWGRVILWFRCDIR